MDQASSVADPGALQIEILVFFVVNVQKCYEYIEVFLGNFLSRPVQV
jgi:hypothetical protein